MVRLQPTLSVNGAVGAVGEVAPLVLDQSAVGDRMDALREVGGWAAPDAMGAWRSIKDVRDAPMATLV